MKLVCHFIFAFALRRSAQYFFIRADTALRAAADIVRMRVFAFSTPLRIARRRFPKASSGNVRSSAIISARKSLSAASVGSQNLGTLF